MEHLLRGDLAVLHRQLKAWVDGGDAEALRAFLRELETADSGVSRERIVREMARLITEAVIRHVQRAGEPGPLLRVLANLPGVHDHLAVLAAHLAGRAPDRLEALFAGPGGNRELLWLLFQEALLRKLPCAESPVVQQWAEQNPPGPYHPLGGLPPRRTALEEGELPVRWYNDQGGGGYTMPFGPDCLGHGEPLGRSGAFPPCVESSTPEWQERAGAAVANWMAHSNGKAEVREFLLSEPADPGDLSVGALQALELEALKGVQLSRVGLERLPAPVGFTFLFAAAANGGAYNEGLGAAWGRAQAWRATTALTGLPEGAGITTVADVAQHCTWYQFEAPSDWYYAVAWDIGLVVLRPDGLSLAVLAATDTD